MKLYDILEPDFIFKNEKGLLTQLVHEGYEQVNVLVSHAGTERGGHYHKDTKEAFYVVEGSVDLLLYKDNEREEVRFRKGEFFVIHPYVIHEMSFSEECTMVAMYTKYVERDNGEKDIHIAEQ